MLKCLILLVLCSCASCLYGRFFTPQDCYSNLVPPSRDCFAALPQYRYNPYLGYCEQYINGGCHVDRNSFNTYEECAYVTYPVCRPNAYPPAVPLAPPLGSIPLQGTLPPSGSLVPPPGMPEVLPGAPSPWETRPGPITGTFPMKKK